MDDRGARQTSPPQSNSARIRVEDAADAWDALSVAQEAYAGVRVARQEPGVVHTPRAIAVRMAERLFEGAAPGSRWRVLDPGCGAAQLLTAVAQQASQRSLSVTCHGIDIDPAAVRWARRLNARVRRAAGASLQGWRIREVDYLLSRRRGACFDAVIANPPWVPLKALAAEYRCALRARYPGRSDLAALFVDRMLDDLAPGGRLCVIVPNKLLAADYARTLRQRVLAELRVHEVWDLSATAPFRGHATYPVVIVAQRPRAAPRSRAQPRLAVRESDGRVRATWPQASVARLPAAALPLTLPGRAASLLERLATGTRFGDHVRVACGIATSGFARGIGRGDERIICSGDVRPFRNPTTQPFDRGAAGLDDARLQRMRVPKVVIPGMFRRLHAGYDAHGFLLGRVYYVAVEGRTTRQAAARRALLLALLNSRLYAMLYRGLFGAVAQSGGWLRLNAPYLQCMPWPLRVPGPSLARSVRGLMRSESAALRRQLDAQVEELFDLTKAESAVLASLEPVWNVDSERPRLARRASKIRAPKSSRPPGSVATSCQRTN